MNLDQAIQFYDNNITSLIEMANNQKEVDPGMWKTFEDIANDCNAIIEDSLRYLNRPLNYILSNSNRSKILEYHAENESDDRAISAFIIKLDDYIKGKDLSQFRKYSYVQTNPDLSQNEYYVFDGFEMVPHSRSTWERNYEIVPVKIIKDRANILEFEDRLFDNELLKLFYIFEHYPRWYHSLKSNKSKLGSWSQRNLPTFRSLLGMRENKKPYISNVLNKNLEIRGFYSNTPQKLLEWHRDNEDRIILIKEGKGWFLQKDNEIPQKLIPGKYYKINKNNYHRVLKEDNSSDLIIMIYKH